MSATVDHLAAYQLLRILQPFTDAAGNDFQHGETGRIRHIHLDWKTFVCTIELEQGGTVRNIVLNDPKSPNPGPRSGRMREFFEVEAMDVGPPEPDHEPQDDLTATVEPEPEAEAPGDSPGLKAYKRALQLEREDALKRPKQSSAKPFPTSTSQSPPPTCTAPDGCA